jgi:hypothetical protein
MKRKWIKVDKEQVMTRLLEKVEDEDRISLMEVQANKELDKNKIEELKKRKIV